MNRIKSVWNLLSRFPGGKFIFSKLLRVFVPYSGSIDAQILELRSGYALVKLKDKKFVRNHLKSIHAIALANLGELTSGLAFVMSWPPEFRGIVTEIRIQYHKKARGTLFAESTSPKIQSSSPHTCEVEARIYDSAKDLVASVQVQWKLESQKKAG